MLVYGEGSEKPKLGNAHILRFVYLQQNMGGIAHHISRLIGG